MNSFCLLLRVNFWPSHSFIKVVLLLGQHIPSLRCLSLKHLVVLAHWHSYFITSLFIQIQVSLIQALFDTAERNKISTSRRY